MRESPKEQSPRETGPVGFFLPDFCNVRIILAVVIIAELLAFVLALSVLDDNAGRWSSLNLISLLVQWIALTSTAVLCVARPLLSRLGTPGAATWSYATILITATLVSEAAFRLARSLNLGVQIPDSAHVHFIFRNVVISAIVGAVALRYFYVQHELKRNIAAEARARLDALHARIRPHFLFNSMNTIASLTRTSPTLAEEAVEDLADLFRVSLADSRTLVPLTEELELVRRYLRIEQLRLGDRLEVAWEVDTLPESAQLPALLLQPLVENAIYHGIEPRPEGGTIRISVSVTDETVTLRIANPVTDSPSNHRTGNRIALDNVRQRLQAHFGSRGRLEVTRSDHEYIIRLTLPLLKEYAHSNR